MSQSMIDHGKLECSVVRTHTRLEIHTHDCVQFIRNHEAAIAREHLYMLCIACTRVYDSTHVDECVREPNADCA